LNIGSQCDINYKNSKSQRLLVELALMKMAHLTDVLAQTNSPLDSSQAVKKKVM
jgi:DNA polymerase-3 subunit gamma/tau